MYFKLDIFNRLNKKIESESSLSNNPSQESEELNAPFLLSLYADTEFMDFVGYCYSAVQYLSLLCFIMGLILFKPGLMIVGVVFFAETSMASPSLEFVNQLAQQIKQVIQHPENQLKAMNDKDIELGEALPRCSP